MRIVLSILFLSSVTLRAGDFDRYSVLVVFNSRSAESAQIAKIYAEARAIPADNLIGLDVANEIEISREDYQRSVERPLRAAFDRNLWWSRSTGEDGLTRPTSNDIRIIVTVRGMPLRIKDTNDIISGAGKDGKRGASVDSELAMLGVEGLPTEGALSNPFFKSERSIWETYFPWIMLTSRIDGASRGTCERIIKDSVETEKIGLNGFSYVDRSGKYPQGEQWLSAIAQRNAAMGIPTITDHAEDTFAAGYPMAHAALYFGWYDPNISGPFLKPAFRLRRGAIAVHIHSFSACQLSDERKNWCAGLLERGAAATVGNVDEPYLGLTHHLDILHSRLLDGFTWAEACWMSLPATSWQTVCLGDPLYRPFPKKPVINCVESRWLEFKFLRDSRMRAANSEDVVELWMREAERRKSGLLAEAVGLELQRTGRVKLAREWFEKSSAYSPNKEDKQRQRLHEDAD
jgi:uncharacterized protein (TIGR03790 family)